MRAIRIFGWALAAAALASAGTFGTPVAIGGHASDIALDEPRNALYIANFTANRIEVMSLSDNTIRTSINVAPQPGALALSPDGQYLLVAHFGNWADGNSQKNALTVLNLGDGTRQTFSLGFPPLGISFGADGLALVVTNSDFMLFDPVSGATREVDTISSLAAKTLPQPADTFPPQIVAASTAASADGLTIYGLADTIRFRYEVQYHRLTSLGYTASPPMGPRVVSVSSDGSYYTAGWGLFDWRGRLVAQYDSPAGLLNVGSHAIDSASNTIYAQIPRAAAVATPAPAGGSTPSTPATPATPPARPTLMVMDADNLALREELLLPENLAGRSLLNAAADTLYAVSDSGVLVLPVGRLSAQRRVYAPADVLLRGNFCDRGMLSADIQISDPGGNRTDFALSTTAPGVRFSPASGTTPATVRVQLDTTQYQNQNGTTAIPVDVRSNGAVNVPRQIRLLVNNRNPDQRGTLVNVPGRLVDLLADPARDRFYILRQDTNEVLVFDANSYQQIAVLRTSNTPTQMAITFDRRYLLVGHDNSQLAYVYDLETLQPSLPVTFPFGHYPRSLAASGKAILGAVRSAAGPHAIDTVDFAARTAAMLPSLGVYTNSVHINTTLTPAPNGASILAAMPDGNVMLYDANVDTFTLSRKDFVSLAGAYAASSYGQYVVDNNLLNASLVPAGKLETASGASSGFAFVDQGAFRTTARAAAGNPGVVQRVDLASASAVRPTSMVEAPPAPPAGFAFSRTLAPLYNRSALISLTVSGFTVLPWNYDAAVARPVLQSVVNAADYSKPVAPGSLISVFGTALSPVNMATRDVPLPTALGESCLTVNGVPVPVLFVSDRQINGQLPYNVDGNALLTLRTPGGVSDNLNLTILPAAPGVFRSSADGGAMAMVIRAKNGEPVTGSNPVHPEDTLVIYATGLGRTAPAVDAGVPAPADPLPAALIQPQVTLGGMALPVGYAGLVPGEIGVYQINVAVPAKGVPIGMQVPLAITQAGSATSIPVRVVN